MKLLFDENLSHKLARNLSDLFPDSAHVRDLSLLNAADSDVWTAAVGGGFTIVTKDTDFSELSVVKGHPPKVLRVQLGNCSTGQIESLIRWRVDVIREFGDDPDLSLLELA